MKETVEGKVDGRLYQFASVTGEVPGSAANNSTGLDPALSLSLSRLTVSIVGFLRVTIKERIDTTYKGKIRLETVFVLGSIKTFFNLDLDLSLLIIIRMMSSSENAVLENNVTDGTDNNPPRTTYQERRFIIEKVSL